jgi:hypothetical protein
MIGPLVLRGPVMRLILSASLVVALIFPLAGCVSPNPGVSAAVPKTQYPSNLITPTDILPVLL